jgi:hypothetical protein
MSHRIESHLSLAQPVLQELEMTDTRTPEQHMADVANYTVERLARLEDELDPLQSQLDALSDWAAEHQLNWHRDFFADLAEAVEALRNCVPDVVCELGLPVCGINHSENA